MTQNSERGERGMIEWEQGKKTQGRAAAKARKQKDARDGVTARERADPRAGRVTQAVGINTEGRQNSCGQNLQLVGRCLP